MKVDLILVCEAPNFGRRGHRKFWAASYDSGDGVDDTRKPSVATRWGRIPDGSTINIEWLSAQHKSVPCEDQDCALAFIDKKASEKAQKGYRVVVHIVDDVNIGLLHGSAAGPDGIIKMRTYRGT
jgi:predicted DNA-binding WGR domain protein